MFLLRLIYYAIMMNYVWGQKFTVPIQKFKFIGDSLLYIWGVYVSRRIKKIIMSAKTLCVKVWKILYVVWTIVLLFKPWFELSCRQDGIYLRKISGSRDQSHDYSSDVFLHSEYCWQLWNIWRGIYMYENISKTRNSAKHSMSLKHNPKQLLRNVYNCGRVSVE